MAYGGGGGLAHPEYGGGGHAPTHVWPPPGPSSPASIRALSPAAAPARALSPAAAPFQPARAVYHNPAAMGLHVGAYQHGVVHRTPAPTPYAPAAPVTIRSPPPSPATVRAPSPAAAPFQPARVSAPPPAPAPPTPRPSTASIAKELEQKLFVSETALAPPAAAAVAAAVAAQPAAEKAAEVDLAPVSKKGLAHPARPGAGTGGRKVMIRANHFLVNVADNNLFHYDVSINPESKSRQTNREVLSELIKVHGKTSLGGKLPAYDGRKSLYTAGSLPFESEEFSVTLVDPEKKDKERAEREYKITIRIAGRTDLYHLQQFLCGRQRDMPQETIQVLDVVLRESPSWNYVTVSRSFFSTTFGHRGDIGEGLECWRGYYQSLRPTQMGLSLNIDISATSFFKPVTVVQFVQEFLNLRDVSRPLNDRDRVKIKKALRGVRVETNHQEDQIRRYKITGITAIPMSQLIFPVDERGTRMSVVQYFSQRYQYKLQHTNWPCLQSGSDARPVYLPMEACKIVEGQRYSKKLNDKQVTNILRATCQRPQQREQSIREMVLHNKYAEDKFAQEFGIKVCNDLVSVPARVLPPPMVVASMDWPEITKYRGLVAAQPHRQEIIEDLFNVTPERSIQALVKFLHHGTLVIPFHVNDSVEHVRRTVFAKLKISEATIRVNGRPTSSTDQLSKFVAASDNNCSVSVTGYLLGGVRHQLPAHIQSIGTRIFEVTTIPDSNRAPHLPPFLVTLSEEASSIGLLLLSLVNTDHTLTVSQCPGRFTPDQIYYDPDTKDISFDPAVGRGPYSETAYKNNLWDIGRVFQQSFIYSYSELLNNSASIHVPYVPPSLDSWRLPTLVDYLAYDLQVGFRNRAVDIEKNHKYFMTHIGFLSSIARAAYTLTHELQTDFSGGEHYLEDVVGLRIAPIPPQPHLPPKIARYKPIPSFLQQAQLSPSFDWMLDPKRNKKGRSYLFDRVGAKWSSNRNHFVHADDFCLERITARQAEAYGLLVYPGLTYNVRLRSQFPTQPVDWHLGPPPVCVHSIPAQFYNADTSGLNRDWVKNDFTQDEMLRLTTRS